MQRPVDYVLWSISTQSAIVIIPEEAELVIPILQATRTPSCHLMVYAAPITRNMLHFCDLDYYALPCLPKDHTLPDWLAIELGILGGRLYFNFAEYEPLQRHLRAMVSSATDEEEAAMQNVSLPPHLTNFLLEWLSIKRKGQDITSTPMGYLCHGRRLHDTHAFFNAVLGSAISPPMKVNSMADHADRDGRSADGCSGVDRLRE